MMPTVNPGPGNPGTDQSIVRSYLLLANTSWLFHHQRIKFAIKAIEANGGILEGLYFLDKKIADEAIDLLESSTKHGDRLFLQSLAQNRYPL